MNKIFLGGDFNDDLRLKLVPLLTVNPGDVFVSSTDLYRLCILHERSNDYKHRVYVITPSTNIELRRVITEDASVNPEDVTLMFMSYKDTFRPNHRRIFAPLTNLIGTVRSTIKGDVHDLATILNNAHERYN